MWFLVWIAFLVWPTTVSVSGGAGGGGTISYQNFYDTGGTTANMNMPNHHVPANGVATPSISDDDVLATSSKGVVPAGTDKCARWTLTSFAAWMNLESHVRVKSTPTTQWTGYTQHAHFLVDIFRFVLETRKSNCHFIPPKHTITQLLGGLLQTFVKILWCMLCYYIMLLHACISHLIVYCTRKEKSKRDLGSK